MIAQVHVYANIISDALFKLDHYKEYLATDIKYCIMLIAPINYCVKMTELKIEVNKCYLYCLYKFF